MTISRDDFALECMQQALYFGVNAHYLVGIAELRSGISDDPDGARIGPYRLTADGWAELATDREFDLDLKTDDIGRWYMQCAAFGVSTHRSQTRLFEKLKRFPSAK